MHALVARSAHPAVVVSRDRPVDRSAFAGPEVRSLAWAGHVRPARAVRAARSLGLEVVARGRHAQVVHVHFGYAAHDVLGLVRRRRLPLVLSLHGDDVTALPRLRPGHYDHLTGVVDALVVPSRWLAVRTAELGFAPDRTHVVPSGVDLVRFSPTPLPDGPPRVAFVGRLVEKKGIDVLLSAWPAVRAAVPGAELDVLGDGPLRSAVGAAAAAPGSGVTTHRPDPARRHEQVQALLRGATVVATPSRTAADGDAESLLLVNLEAQASARPVVTTRHGGIPEFVDEGRSALVVPEGDARALAEGIASVLRDRALAARLGGAGPAVASRFTVERGAAAVDSIYDALLEGSRRGR